MSVTITINDPRGGHIYTIETPLDSVASTKQDVTYQETQQMISEYAARTVNTILGAGPRRMGRIPDDDDDDDDDDDGDYYNDDRGFHDDQRYERHLRNTRRSPDYNDYQPPQAEQRRHRDERSRSPVRNESLRRYPRNRSPPPKRNATRRELDSRFVQRATGYELTDADTIMVGVGPAGTVEYKFIIKRYTPLRRLVNAYCGLSHMDVKFFELQWQGHRLGWGDEDTAEKYGILHGCDLAIAARPFVRDPELLAEFGPGEDHGSDSELQYEPKIKPESERGGSARSSIRLLTVACNMVKREITSSPEHKQGEENTAGTSESSTDTSEPSSDTNSGDGYSTAEEGN